MTSCPASTSNAAATDESTPPDIATRTRSLTAPIRNYRASSMQYRGQLPNLVNDLRQCTDDRIHVLRRAVLPERKAQRRHAELARHAHRGEHVRRLHRPGAAGRARRAGDAGEVEMHEQGFGVGPGDCDVRDVGRALGPRAVDHSVGQDVEQPPLQLVAQRAHRGGEVGLLAGRELHRPPQSDDPRHVLRARPQPELLPTAASSPPRAAWTGKPPSSPPRCCPACGAASPALCSVAATATRNGPPRSRAASAEPITARLSASVPPEVKITWPGSTPRARAIVRLASSTPARAARPNRWADDGFPKASLPR